MKNAPLKDQPLLKKIYRLAQKNKIALYLVGGYLRDIILGREKESPDIDFSLKESAIEFGRHIAGRLSAGFVVLDKVHGSSRAVKKIKGKTYTLDFTDFRGEDLTDDLLHRDFAINALALELKDAFNKNFKDLIIDPCRGLKDLKSGEIRIVNKNAFDEDPLRILRAFSLSSTFNFKIDEETLKLAALKKDKLSGVSFERIRDELFKILDRPNSYDYLARMDELGILKIIIPEIEIMRGVEQGPYHHLDVLRHSLESLRQADLAMFKGFKRNKEIQDYLNENICAQRKRRALVKLGAFLHDIGKPSSMRHEDGKTKFHGHERLGLELTENIARRLRLSNDEIESLKKMVLWHLRPGYMADNEDLSQRAIFRYFRDTADEAASTLIVSLADQRSTKGPLTSEESRRRHEQLVSRLIKEYFRRKKEKKITPFLNGDDLIKKFKLAPSPLIGKILSELEELQAIGKIKTEKEALAAAKKVLNKEKK